MFILLLSLVNPTLDPVKQCEWLTGLLLPLPVDNAGDQLSRGATLLLTVGGVGGGAALGVGLPWRNLSCVTVFSTGFKMPILIFTANEGMFFLPPLSSTIFGTLLILIVLLGIAASAVLFLALPCGPGQPSHPSRVSRRSSSHVGLGPRYHQRYRWSQHQPQSGSQTCN